MIDGGVGNDSIQVKMGRYWYWDDGTNESYELYSQASVNGGADDDVIEIEAYNTTTKGSWEWDEDTGKEIWNAGTGIEDISGIVTVKAGAGNDTIRNKFLYKYEDGHTYFNDSDYYDPSIYEDYDGKPYKVSRTVTSYFKTPTTYTTVITWKMSDGTSKTSSITSNLIYNRLIQYADGDGDDVVEDYNVGDTLQIAGTYSTANSGNDVVISVGSGSIKLVGAKGKKLNIVEGDLNPTVDPEPGVSEYIKLTNASIQSYTATDGVVTIDASERTKVVKITGNDEDNVIIGGSKNDTFIGKGGNDTFVSDAGKDFVTDYEVGDFVSLTGDISKVAASGNNVTLTSNKGSIVLNGAKGKKVTFIDGSGNVTKQTFGVNKLNIVDGDGSTINVANDATVITLDASDRTEDIILIGNAKANTLIGGSGDDELTGGKGKDLFIYSGGDDLITDYTAGQDIIQLANGVSIQSFTYTGDQDTDLVLQTNEGNLTIENAIALKSSKGKITRTPQQIKIIDGNNITTSQSYQLGTINTLSGGSSADTISGFSTNDLLVGGKGKDVFIYGSGHDTISDYIVNQDSIILNLGNANDYSINGSDVVIPIDEDNSLTIQNAKAKKVKINNVDITFDDQVNVTLDNKSTSPYTATDKAMTIDATKRTKAIKIVANSDDNTINGGKGNDTLTGGAGKDVFKYTVNTGNDVITDYSASEGDIIKLGKKTSITSVETKNDDLIFTIGKNKLTLQNAADKTITLVDDNNFKITYQKWSESIGYEEKYFVDDNFATNDLDEIISSDSNLISGDLDLKNNFDQSNQIISVNNKKK